MQRQLGEGELLDDRGHLIEAGWAVREVRRYNRSRIRAGAWRIKEWDYYCILTDRFALALTVADNGYLGFLGLSWMDLVAGTAVNHGAVRALPLGRMGLLNSADCGDVVQQHGDVALAFRHEDGGRRLTFSAPGFDDGKGLSGELWLDQPPMDRMVIATPFRENPCAFYYNQKINCMPVSGTVTLGGEAIALTADTAFAVLDWGRGVWTYDNTWYWGSASGLVEGRPFGFNIGYGFGDTSAASENIVFVDGRAHKLDRVQFVLPDGPLDGAPWQFTSNDQRFTMTFQPIVNRRERINLGLFQTLQDQVFGRFTGTVVLDDGAALEVRDLVGFAEKVRNRW